MYIFFKGKKPENSFKRTPTHKHVFKEKKMNNLYYGGKKRIGEITVFKFSPSFWSVRTPPPPTHHNRIQI
jgi:hypothetical protein